MTEPSSRSRVQRVRHEVKRREVEVVRVATLSTTFRSVTFAGESLTDFVSASFDDHVKFILNAESAEPVRRDYTPRLYDRAERELTIEYSLHSDGPAARWAAEATPGQRATIGGPRSSMIIPMDYAWHLLIGDETALPAIARRLEELPTGAKVTVIGHIADRADRRELVSSASPEVHWVASDAELFDAVRSMTLPAGEGYVWCAGEAGAMTALRRLLVEEKGHDRRAIRAAAYWKRGATAHHENLDD